MKKELAILAGPGRNRMTTRQFLDKLDENLKAAMGWRRPITGLTIGVSSLKTPASRALRASAVGFDPAARAG